jgi:hypothetical protein
VSLILEPVENWQCRCSFTALAFRLRKPTKASPIYRVLFAMTASQASVAVDAFTLLVIAPVAAESFGVPPTFVGYYTTVTRAGRPLPRSSPQVSYGVTARCASSRWRSGP